MRVAKYFYALALVLFFGSFVPGLIWGGNGFAWSFALSGLVAGVGFAVGMIELFD